jgi:hypothetical protein
MIRRVHDLFVTALKSRDFSPAFRAAQAPLSVGKEGVRAYV